MYPRRQIERRECYADVVRDGWSHRWRVQRALTESSVVAVHVVRVSCCITGPWRELYFVVIVVLWNGGGEWEVEGKFCGPLDTDVHPCVDPLNAFAASSLCLLLFYYEDIICMVFIIQVDLDSRWGKVLIGCFIKSHVRRRCCIRRLKHLTRRVGNILIGGKIVLLWFFNKTGMIGHLVEDPSPRRFFDFIVLYGSPGKGARRNRKRDWVGVFAFELGTARWLVGLLFVFSFRLF